MGGDLRPCPFCGAAPLVMQQYLGRYACCSTASDDSELCSTTYHHQDDWNHRPVEDDLCARLTAAEAALAAAQAEVAAHDADLSAAHTAGELAALAAVARFLNAEAEGLTPWAARVAMERAAGTVEAWAPLVAQAEATEVESLTVALAAAQAEVAQARADRSLMTGLWLATVPPDVLPTLLPADPGDRDRLAAALDAVDLQASAGSHTAAGRAVIGRIVAETDGGAR